jgi:zinc protease
MMRLILRGTICTLKNKNNKLIIIIMIWTIRNALTVKGLLKNKALRLSLLLAFSQQCHSIENIQSGDFFSLPYTEVEFENKLKLVMIQVDDANLTSVNMNLQVGSRNEVEQGKSGFSHLFAHVMELGSKEFNQDRRNLELKKIAAEGSGSEHEDYINLSKVIPKEHLEKLLMLEADRFQNLWYNEDMFKNEAGPVLGEYLKNEDRQFRKIRSAFLPLAYKTHTYRHSAMGVFEDIQKMSQQYEYSKLFFKRYYSPERTTILIVGDHDKKQTISWVKNYFGNWEASNYRADIPQEPEHKAPLVKFKGIENKTSITSLMGFKIPSITENLDDFAAIDLMRPYFFGEPSSLRGYFKNENDINWIGGWASKRKDPFELYLYISAKNVVGFRKAKTKLNSTIRDTICSEIDEQKLSEIKSHEYYNKFNQLVSVDAIGKLAAEYVHFNRDLSFANQYYEAFRKVNANDIKSVAKKYLKNNTFTNLTFHPVDLEIENDDGLFEFLRNKTCNNEA